MLVVAGLMKRECEGNEGSALFSYADFAYGSSSEAHEYTAE